jgi:hypothetical protein
MEIKIILALIIAGIGFLLWFLAGLAKERSTHRPQHFRILHAIHSTQMDHSSFKDYLDTQRPVMAARLVWRFRTGHSQVKKEPSCGMSSSYF